MHEAPLAIDLRTERQIDPIGLDEQRPRLSWRIQLAAPAVEQASFAIQAATDPAFGLEVER
jgi:alpha-L-rhamnosidase